MTVAIYTLRYIYSLNLRPTTKSDWHLFIKKLLNTLAQLLEQKSATPLASIPVPYIDEKEKIQ